jgi:hypothetical protein
MRKLANQPVAVRPGRHPSRTSTLIAICVGAQKESSLANRGALALERERSIVVLDPLLIAEALSLAVRLLSKPADVCPSVLLSILTVCHHLPSPREKSRLDIHEVGSPSFRDGPQRFFQYRSEPSGLVSGGKVIVHDLHSCARSRLPTSALRRARQFTVSVAVPTVAVTWLDEPFDVPVPVTVTVYVPAGVPEFPTGRLPPLPQPIALIEANSTTSPSIASQLHRPRGTRISNTSPSTVAPADGHSSFFIWLCALDAAVVITVSVEVCAVIPLRVTTAGLILQVAGSLAAGLIEQLRFTVPEYPLIPITLIVELLPVVAPRSTVIAASLPLAPLAPKLGSAVTVR